MSVQAYGARMRFRVDAILAELEAAWPDDG